MFQGICEVAGGEGATATPWLQSWGGHTAPWSRASALDLHLSLLLTAYAACNNHRHGASRAHRAHRQPTLGLHQGTQIHSTSSDPTHSCGRGMTLSFMCSKKRCFLYNVGRTIYALLYKYACGARYCVQLSGRKGSSRLCQCVKLTKPIFINIVLLFE